MNDIIEKNRNSLVELCHRFEVKRLEVFGSVTGDFFNPLKSDIDFLVEFQESTAGEHSARYFGLLSALQDLFSRNIDLIETKAIKNPYFRKNIELSRKPVYG